MKYINSSLLSLFLVCGSAAAPCCAQQAVEAGGAIDPVEISIPEIAIQDDVENGNTARLEEIIRKATDEAGLSLFAPQSPERDALRQYENYQVFPTVGSSWAPGMAKKTREIALLRQMLALKLSARDLERAIPLLREMKESDKVVPVKPEQAMDEEYNALLRAKPGDPIPPSSSLALRDAAGNFRSRKQAIWDKMAQEIGKEKTAGIKSMLRSEGAGSFFTNGSGRSIIGLPGVATPFRYELQTPRRLALPATPRVKPVLPDGTETPKPPSDVNLNVPGQPRVATPPTEVPAPGADTAPVPLALVARVRSPRGAAVPVDPIQSTVIATPAIGQVEVGGSHRVRRSATAPSAAALAPSAGAFTVGPGSRSVLSYGFFGQISLDEHIDLFERKLAAMRK